MSGANFAGNWKLWFHSFASPAHFHRATNPWKKFLAISATILLVTGSVWGFFFAPADARQGEIYRIIYVHVPAAIAAELLYVGMAVAGAVALIWRLTIAGLGIRALASTGIAMTALTLVSGSIWGIPTWGTWWLWSDPRLMSSLLLLLLFVGVYAVAQAFDSDSRGERMAAILSLVGLANLPILKWSVEWFTSIHQPASISLTEASSIDPAMLWPLILCILGWNLAAGLAVLLRVRYSLAQRYPDRVRL